MVLGGHGFWRCAVQLAAGWQVTVPDVFSLSPVCAFFSTMVSSVII